jgi:hypothetical protein
MWLITCNFQFFVVHDTLHSHRSLSGRWSHRCTSTHHVIVSDSETLSLIHIDRIHCQWSQYTKKDVVRQLYALSTPSSFIISKRNDAKSTPYSTKGQCSCIYSTPIITTPYSSVLKMWCKMFCTGSCLVNKSASLSCVFTYVVRHSSLTEPSHTKCYTILCDFFFKLESGIVVFAKTDWLSP